MRKAGEAIMGAFVIAGAVVAVAGPLFVVYAVLARFVLHGPVTASSLYRSVKAGAGAGDASSSGLDQTCTRAADGWRCVVADPQSSGALSYRVRIRPRSSCWDGRLVGHQDEGAPTRIHGCVHRWQWTLLG